MLVHNEVSVKTGEELKLDVLLSNADKVQHQSRRSTEWMKDWSRTDGVQSERMTIRDRNLIISNFTARDAGTYRVLDPDGEILITVTVTGERNSVDSFTKILNSEHKNLIKKNNKISALSLLFPSSCRLLEFVSCTDCVSAGSDSDCCHVTQASAQRQHRECPSGRKW
uniref:Immunoglobulin V-set domain-containing protein n=1 Tax=Sinocyclocheilus anshuiensis TaxID=1608454 RepID=A0A671MI13_9TELE